MDTVLNFKNDTVRVKIGKNIVFKKDFISFCKSLKKQFVIISDSNVSPLYGKELNSALAKNNLDCLIIEIEAGEEHKTRATKEHIENTMFEKKLGRDTCIIALGGGVICDLSAFVAATYCRGIDFITIPTTLLAMVDAAIGGKCGVNTRFGKNLLGSFYHPKAIFIDLQFLSSLPLKEKRNGLLEIIKYGIIYDKELFFTLYENSDNLDLEKLIYKSFMIKKIFVEQDEKDNNKRAALNFGHTIGHAIEVLEDFSISHGEAVAIGIIVASFISMKLNVLEKEDFFKIFTIFKRHKFPLIFSQKVSWKALLNLLILDKKAKNKKPYFVLLEEIGKIKVFKDSYVKEVDEELLKKSLIWMQRRFASKT